MKMKLRLLERNDDDLSQECMSDLAWRRSAELVEIN